jgi:hypothetical protein
MSGRRIRKSLFLGVLLLISNACKQTEFEHLVDIPSRFEVTNFVHFVYPVHHLTGHFNAGSTNNGADCARVSGTIDWGDGVVQEYETIPPCVSVNKNMPNWQSNPDQEHNYPAVGTYHLAAVLTAHYTNGAITSTFRTPIVVDK